MPQALAKLEHEAAVEGLDLRQQLPMVVVEKIILGVNESEKLRLWRDSSHVVARASLHPFLMAKHKSHRFKSLSLEGLLDFGSSREHFSGTKCTSPKQTRVVVHLFARSCRALPSTCCQPCPPLTPSFLPFFLPHSCALFGFVAWIACVPGSSASHTTEGWLTIMPHAVASAKFRRACSKATGLASKEEGENDESSDDDSNDNNNNDADNDNTSMKNNNNNDDDGDDDGVNDDHDQYPHMMSHSTKSPKKEINPAKMCFSAFCSFDVPKDDRIVETSIRERMQVSLELRSQFWSMSVGCASRPAGNQGQIKLRKHLALQRYDRDTRVEL